MKTLLIVAFLAALFSTVAHAQLQLDGATATFRGSLPPKPTTELSSDQIKKIEASLALVMRDFAAVKKHPRAADADIFLKAVRYAIEFHECYGKKPE